MLVRLADEEAPLVFVGMEVPPEVVGIKEQEHTAPGLIADPPGLLLAVGPREEQACPARSWRRHDDPTHLLLRDGSSRTRLWPARIVSCRCGSVTSRV